MTVPVVGPAVPDPSRPGWDDVQRLAEEIWAWRRVQAPRSRDDIPRQERPADWAPDFSADGVAAARARRQDLHDRWTAVDLAGADVATRVDHAVLGSVLARVRWELDVLRSHERDASFWVDQTLGPVFDALLQPPPFGPDRVARLGHLLAVIPDQVATARAQLTSAQAELATVALDMLADAGTRLRAAIAALPVSGHAGPAVVPGSTVRPELDPGPAVRPGLDPGPAVRPGLDPGPAVRPELDPGPAADALDGFAAWLRAELPGMAPFEPVGRAAFEDFLRQVALAPEPVDWMVTVAEAEFARAVTMEAVATAAAADVPVPPLPVDVAAHCADEAAAEVEVRRWYDEKGLLTVPAWTGRYLFAPRPPWLDPLVGMGVTDDLLGPSRLGQDPVSYAPHPAPELPFFYRANMLDPRLGVAHEGVHALQLTWSATHPDPVRREYVDSQSNEGIAFYDEELLLDSGLWADAPHSRVVVARFLRLRALRVLLDVGLATGSLSIDDATRMLAERVPVDEVTAREEAAFFAGTPGQALTYLVGKVQIQRLLADLVAAQGEAFDLRAFHDRLWLEGNVPIAMQRWELLGTEPDLG